MKKNKEKSNKSSQKVNIKILIKINYIQNKE